LLFSLYINDVDRIAWDVRGAVTGVADVCVTHMLYADDLSLTANEPGQLQMMLAKGYALPARMYASQIWGTRYMKQGAAMDCPLQTVHMC